MKNPYADEENKIRVQADIGPRDYIYLFRSLLPFRGTQGKLIAVFIHRFCEALREQNLPTSYDPENEDKVYEILNRLNFREAHQPEQLDLGIEEPEPEERTIVNGGQRLYDLDEDEDDGDESDDDSFDPRFGLDE